MFLSNCPYLSSYAAALMEHAGPSTVKHFDMRLQLLETTLLNEVGLKCQKVKFIKESLQFCSILFLLQHVGSRVSVGLCS